MTILSRFLPGVMLCISTVAIAADETPVNVKTVSYKEVAFYPEHSTAAEVIARHDSKISAEISAVVDDIIHDTGDRVNEGDTVIALDCRTYELQLQQAEAAHDAVIAQLENAKKLYASAQKLQKQNNISQEVYNQRSADASRLKAESLNTKAGIEAARIAVDKCSIKAPYDGYISERFISKGEHAQAGTPVFQMITSEQGSVEAHINSFEYQSFLQGSDYRFIFNGTSYELAIDSILPVLDKIYRTHTARLSFVAESAPTGSHGDLKWRDNKLAIPSSLVVIRDHQAGVLVTNSNKARFVPVASYVEGHPAPLRLDPDTQIISMGRHGLEHGDSINVITPE
ncbi:MAG: efflux RND transporter periplasmic adaptor subunit [Gammaproteobacteria bacterium]|jgi:RND family efflux transporter MFP subunit